MRYRLVLVMLVALAPQSIAEAQAPESDQHAPMAPRFIDRVSGVTLDQAIEQALGQEPGLRAARADIDVARGMSAQAALRPNPTVTFAQLTEPRGTDAQTRIDVEWPLDLFRKAG